MDQTHDQPRTSTKAVVRGSVQRPCEVVQGDDGVWGVMQGEAVLYDPSFSRATAEAIADLENSENPPKDWRETQDRLAAMGLPS